LAKKRLLRRTLAALVVLAIVVVATGPSLCSRAPIRDWVLALSFPNLRGTVHSGGAELGWFSPVVCRELEIFGEDGSRVMAVREIRGDRPLWRLIAVPTSLGSFRADGAKIEVRVTDRGANLAHLLDPTGKRGNVDVGFNVVDGVFSFQGRDADQAWDLAPVNLAAEIVAARPAEGRATELVIKPGHLFDHAALTPAMSADLLKYVLPVLADASTVSGQFSVELD